MKIKHSAQDKALYAISTAVMVLFTIIVLYPIIYVLSSSFSSGLAISTGRVVLFPVDFSFDGYRAVFDHKNIVSGYRNTIFYTAVGTLISVAMTMIAAYPMSRKDMQWKRFYMILFTVTMFFSGGLIPNYILVTQLRMINTMWALVIPGCLSVYNMIMVRTFIMSNIPNELLESAQIDGCSDIRYFFMFILPLSKAVIAVISLFYAVGHWNQYFSAMMYLNDPAKFPLSMILREILVRNMISGNDFASIDMSVDKVYLSEILKYALIVVSSLPIIALYPFIQRFFIKGIMIGSIKG